MGIGKVLPTLVFIILSLAVMLSFSMLPAMALLSANDLPVGVCPGGNSGNSNSPWTMIHDHTPTVGADKNGNGHTCFNDKSSIEKDDRIPKNPK